MATVQLPVVRFQQKPGRCGAATAQIILFFTNPAQVGNTPGDQDALWGSIQINTGGKPPASVPASDCPTWNTQQCDKCVGATSFVCWCTYPPALEATLAYYLPMALATPLNDQIFTAAVIDSVDFRIPAAALVFNGLHWLAVAGYETDGPHPQTVNGRAISAIYVSDPEVGAANHSVAIDEWMNDYVSPINQCGIFLNRLAVIAATGPRPILANAPSGPANIRIVGDRAAWEETRQGAPAAAPKRPPRTALAAEESGDEEEGEPAVMTMLDPTVILVHANAEAARLSAVPSWTPAFSESSPDAPLLVQRLDKPDQYLLHCFVPRRRSRDCAAAHQRAERGLRRGHRYRQERGCADAIQDAPSRVSAGNGEMAEDAKKRKKKGPLPQSRFSPFTAGNPAPSRSRRCCRSTSSRWGRRLATSASTARSYDALTFGAGL